MRGSGPRQPPAGDRRFFDRPATSRWRRLDRRSRPDLQRRALQPRAVSGRGSRPEAARFRRQLRHRDAAPPARRVGTRHALRDAAGIFALRALGRAPTRRLAARARPARRQAALLPRRRQARRASRAKSRRCCGCRGVPRETRSRGVNQYLHFPHAALRSHVLPAHQAGSAGRVHRGDAERRPGSRIYWQTDGFRAARSGAPGRAIDELGSLSTRSSAIS